MKLLGDAERGSEVVQFVVVLPLLLLVVFAVVQIGGMTLVTSQLSSEITRACRQLDIAGLERAADKEAFLEAEILGASSQLKAELLQVDHVNWRREAKRSTDEGQALAIEQRTTAVMLSYNVRYEMPSLMQAPGLSGHVLMRTVESTFVEGRTIEVEVKPG